MTFILYLPISSLNLWLLPQPLLRTNDLHLNKNIEKCSFPCPWYQKVPLSLALSPRIISAVAEFKPDIIHASSPGIMVSLQFLHLLIYELQDSKEQCRCKDLFISICGWPNFRFLVPLSLQSFWVFLLSCPITPTYQCKLHI